MAHPLLARMAGRARRALGMDQMAQRLDAIEGRLAGLPVDRYPHPPVYFGDHTAVVATRWGAKMLVDTRDAAIAPWLVLDGLWEADVTEWLSAALSPGDVFVDVGANVGYFTLLGGMRVGPTGRVVAVEAHPHLADLLRRNVVMNDLHRHVTTCQRAAWSERSTVDLHMRTHFTGSSSLGAFGAEALELLADEEVVVRVEAVPVDELLEGLPPVDVLKIDVEGAEPYVVAGLTHTLEASRAVSIVFEWAPPLIESVGAKPELLVDLLEDLGFRFRLIRGDVTPIGRAELLSLPYGNVVAAR